MTRRAKGKGTFYWKNGELYGKWIATIDGVDVRITRKLGTKNELVAKKLVEECAELKIDLHQHQQRAQVPTKRRTEGNTGPSFALAAEQVMGASKVPHHAILLSQLKLHVIPYIGSTPVREVTREDIEATLTQARDKGLARASVKALLQGTSVVLGPFYPEAPVTLTGNGKRVVMTPAATARMPAFESAVRKEYARLTDRELEIYLAWEHPKARFRLAVRQRQTMVALSRCFGGMRTGDIHALKWESLDVANGEFPSGWVPRKKTQKPQKLQIPETLRPVLRAWWEERGRPTEGLIFPSLRGEHAGKGEKKGVSHAEALRRDLQAAMKWAVGQKLPGAVAEDSLRWRELFTETDATLPVNFHSTRRSFADAMKRSGVNQQTAKAFGGWASAAMDRYLGTEDIALPATAFPSLPVRSPAETYGGSGSRPDRALTQGDDTLAARDPKDAKKPAGLAPSGLIYGSISRWNHAAPGPGLEPGTIRLTAERSTD